MAKNDKDYLSRVSSTAFYFLSAIGILGFACSVALVNFVDLHRMLNTDNTLSTSDLRSAMIVSGGIFFSSIPLSLASKILRSMQRGHIPSIIDVLSSTITAFASAVAWANEMQLVGFLVAFSIGTFSAYLLNWLVLLHGNDRVFLPRIRLCSRQMAKELLSTGFLYLVLQLCAAVSFQMDILIINRMIGGNAAADYGIASRLFLLSTSLTGLFAAPLWPAIRDATVRGDHRWVALAFKKSLVMTCGLGLCCTLPMLLFYKPIIRVWTNQSESPPFELIIGLFLWSNVFGIGALLSSLLNGLSKVKVQLIISPILAVTNVLLSIWLTSLIGISGAVWGSLLSYTFCALIPYSWLIPRYLREATIVQNDLRQYG